MFVYVRVTLSDTGENLAPPAGAYWSLLELPWRVCVRVRTMTMRDEDTGAVLEHACYWHTSHPPHKMKKKHVVIATENLSPQPKPSIDLRVLTHRWSQ